MSVMIRATNKAPARTKYTPPEVAAAWGVSPEKILTLIRSGELPAINSAVRLGGRPRFLIDHADIVLFERRRAVVPQAKPAKRPRADTGKVIQFF